MSELLQKLSASNDFTKEVGKYLVTVKDHVLILDRCDGRHVKTIMSDGSMFVTHWNRTDQSWFEKNVNGLV